MGDRLKNTGRWLLAAARRTLNIAKSAGPSLLVTAGMIALSYGVALIYPPAGLIAVGSLAMLLGIGAMRR